MNDNATISHNFYIITGGPGCGKTTLINELESQGYNCVPEAAREIIKKQMAENGNALPWKDTIAYKKLMLDQSVKDYLAANADIITFFDRGIPDTLCYAKVLNMAITLEEDFAAKQYLYNKVFLLPPWKEIYTTDTERKQDWNEAVHTYELMKETYTEYGYDIIEVPKLTTLERVNFVIDKLK